MSKRQVKRSGGWGGHKPGPWKKIPYWNPHWTPPSGAGQLPPDLQDCGRNITPACLKALYQIPNAYLKDNVNQLGLYESGDVYAQSDLNSFFAEYAPNVPQGTHPLLDSIDGGVAPVPADSVYNTGESDIDMDIGFSLIYVRAIRPSLVIVMLTLESLKRSPSTKLTTSLKHLRTVVSTHFSMRSMGLTVPTQQIASPVILQESMQNTQIQRPVATKGHSCAERINQLE
jgi:hypothetical protein